MKITILQRVETSDEISIKCASKADAEKKAAKIAEQSHVIGCRVKACAGGVAILSHVARYHVPKGSRGVVYDVPTEVGDGLIKLKYAKKV